MILEVGLQIIQIGLVAWLLVRKPTVSVFECKHLPCSFKPTKSITAMEIAAALQPNLPIPAMAIPQGTAICTECNRHVAKFENTDNGPVCANCKP